MQRSSSPEGQQIVQPLHTFLDYGFTKHIFFTGFFLTPPSLSNGLWPMLDDQDDATGNDLQARGVAVAEDGSVVVVGITYGDWNATNQGDIFYPL